MRISLFGLKNVPLATPYEFDPQSEYLVPLLCSRESVELHDSHDGEPPESTIKLRVIRVMDIQRVGSKEQIKVVAGKSPSQIQRFKIHDYLARTGEAITEENYVKIMERIGRAIDSWTE